MFAGQENGLLLIVLALVFLVPVLVIIVIRRFFGGRFSAQRFATSQISPDTSNTNEGILVIQAGGRVEYINSRAREWFGLKPEESPDIERIVRRAIPAEEFLNLCAAPGQKRLSIGNQLVEASSYRVPTPYPQMFVAIRAVEFSKDINDTSNRASILRLISDFGRDVSASLDLKEVLHAVLLNVSQLVPSDILEIKTLDSSSQTFVPFILDAVSGGAETRNTTQSQFGEYTDYLIEQREPVLITDTNILPSSMPSVNGSSPVRSYLGFPLLVDDNLIGTLELGHLSSGLLEQQDLDLIHLISPQIAYSLRNALNYSVEQRRVSELSGLANLVESLGTSYDYSNLIQKLVDSVSSLFDVDILGFILFDEDKKSLEAQSPFLGLPSHIVDIYRTPILGNSPAEKIIHNKNVIITDNAAGDKTWQELGLDTLAQAASLRESVLAPMISGERLVGYFQASNHKQSPSEFTQTELHLITTVARQAAGIIENSVDMEKIRQRAMRSDALRRIASLAASTATIDEILRFSIQEIARLFQGDLAAIFYATMK